MENVLYGTNAVLRLKYLLIQSSSLLERAQVRQRLHEAYRSQEHLGFSLTRVCERMTCPGMQIYLRPTRCSVNLSHTCQIKNGPAQSMLVARASGKSLALSILEQLSWLWEGKRWRRFKVGPGTQFVGGGDTQSKMSGMTYDRT